MNRCIQLAMLGMGGVAPNPLVGAVLVHDDDIIGEGYHQVYGQAHAEVNCISNVSDEDKHLIPLSTMYVSLEPCAHHGQTPPCSGLLIKNKIKKVVIGCQDPFTAVNGNGMEQLRAAGIEVVNLNSKESLDLNKRFITFHTKKRPYIILKWAQSIDKFIGINDNKIAISNAYTNNLVHKWRSEEGAIMIGTSTALVDNPQLTTRLWKGANPLRLIIDKHLKIPGNSPLLTDDNPTIILNNIKDEEIGDKLYCKVQPGENFLNAVLEILFRKKVTSLIVEGGTKLLQSFIDAGLWDEARIITNSSLYLKNGIEAPNISSSTIESIMHIESDLIITYKNDMHI